jgi:hypothetical protein
VICNSQHSLLGFNLDHWGRTSTCRSRFQRVTRRLCQKWVCQTWMPIRLAGASATPAPDGPRRRSAKMGCRRKRCLRSRRVQPGPGMIPDRRCGASELNRPAGHSACIAGKIRLSVESRLRIICSFVREPLSLSQLRAMEDHFVPARKRVLTSRFFVALARINTK